MTGEAGVKYRFEELIRGFSFLWKMDAFVPYLERNPEKILTKESKIFIISIVLLI